jgi:hypothetical protein
MFGEENEGIGSVLGNGELLKAPPAHRDVPEEVGEVFPK